MPRHALLPLAFAALLLLAGLSWADGLHALPHSGAGALGILLCTIVLWASGALPLSVTSVLAIGLLAASGVAAPFNKAAAGYETDVVFFLISANLMTQGVVNSGLIDRLAAALADAREADVELSLTLVESLHARWVRLLESIEAAAFARVYHHPERGETRTLGLSLAE
ncbi:MAG: hypothetical protein FJX78_02700 [Armatimonadetes bacterium]|nr:hypothetical protein [Armatimonadota bacterium]